MGEICTLALIGALMRATVQISPGTYRGRPRLPMKKA
jgi:hypothetical protein